jgi:hypothetical protein
LQGAKRPRRVKIYCGELRFRKIKIDYKELKDSEGLGYSAGS